MLEWLRHKEGEPESLVDALRPPLTPARLRALKKLKKQRELERRRGRCRVEGCLHRTHKLSHPHCSGGRG